jgi:hypothetical protein
MALPLEINGYHLFQIPMSYRERGEWDETITVTELENDLSDGYYSQVLFGSNTGLRSWRLRLPTLAGLDVLPNTVTSVNGEQVSREQYLWDLFMETKVTGHPFVFQSPRTGQFYLVRFADSKLSYNGMRVQLYSTGIELKQVRIGGVSIYAPEALENVWLYSVGDDEFVFITWPNRASPETGFPKLEWVAGDVNTTVAGPNGTNVLRLNATGTDGILLMSGDSESGGMPPVIREAWVVMKVNEATFGRHSGVITGQTSNPILVGGDGTTKFFDFGYGDIFYQYSLNGVDYAESDQQAPMNAWGIVRVRHSMGWNIAVDSLQIGQDRDFSGRYLKADIAAVLFSAQLLPKNVERELFEHLVVTYGIGS